MLSRREKFHPSFHFCVMAERGGFSWVMLSAGASWGTCCDELSVLSAEPAAHHPIKISDILIINSSWNHFWLRFYETLNLIRKNGRRKGNFLYSQIFRLVQVHLIKYFSPCRLIHWDGRDAMWVKGEAVKMFAVGVTLTRGYLVKW